MFEWQNDEVAALRAFMKVIGNFEAGEQKRLEKIFDAAFNKYYEMKKDSFGRYYNKGAWGLRHDVLGGFIVLDGALHQMYIDRKTLEGGLREKINDDKLAEKLGEGFGEFFGAVDWGLTSKLLVLGRNNLTTEINRIAEKLKGINPDSVKIVRDRIIKIYDKCKEQIDEDAKFIFEYMIKQFS